MSVELGDAKPQPWQATTPESAICVKGEKSLARVVAEDVLCMGDLIYVEILGFVHVEVKFLSKICISESNQ